ncbi:ankyrin repeat and sterile alpha motif domain-containing protein 1B isoform X1 [Tachysurus ichikawai]
MQDSKHCVEIIQSSSLDVFSPEEEDNPYESVTTAVTRKPCSLDIHLLNSCPRNGCRGNSPGESPVGCYGTVLHRSCAACRLADSHLLKREGLCESGPTITLFT